MFKMIKRLFAWIKKLPVIVQIMVLVVALPLAAAAAVAYAVTIAMVLVWTCTVTLAQLCASVTAKGHLYRVTTPDGMVGYIGGTVHSMVQAPMKYIRAVRATGNLLVEYRGCWVKENAVEIAGLKQKFSPEIPVEHLVEMEVENAIAPLTQLLFGGLLTMERTLERHADSKSAEVEDLPSMAMHLDSIQCLTPLYAARTAAIGAFASTAAFVKTAYAITYKGTTPLGTHLCMGESYGLNSRSAIQALRLMDELDAGRPATLMVGVLHLYAGGPFACLEVLKDRGCKIERM